MYAARGFVVAALVGVALACAKPLPEKTPVSVSPLKFGSGEWRIVDQVVVVTDASGTMYARQTFPEAKALTRSFVSGMPEARDRAKSGKGYAAGHIGFGGDERQAAALAGFDRGRLAQHTAGLKILGSIDGMGGGTPLHRVLYEVAAALEGQRGPAAVVIFSDGLPQPVSEGRTLRAAAYLKESYRDGVCIHTVHVGDDAEGAAFLRKLADLSGCGSSRSAGELTSASAFGAFERQVFAGKAPPPPRVAGPCDAPFRIEGLEFEFDKDVITPAGRRVLDGVARQLAQCPDVRLVVEGHTDSRGSDAYNQNLSERRAASVRRYLVERRIAPDRLQARGYGESRPVASNDTDEGRARNRRVMLRPR